MANTFERVAIALAKGDTYADLEQVLCYLQVSSQGAVPTDADIQLAIQMHALGAKNRCLVCRMDMGINNPRQLCGKTYCLYEYMK